MLVYGRVTPSSISPVPTYTPGWRETMWSKVSCLMKQHSNEETNLASKQRPSDPPTTFWSKVRRANHYNTAPSQDSLFSVFLLFADTYFLLDWARFFNGLPKIACVSCGDNIKTSHNNRLSLWYMACPSTYTGLLPSLLASMARLYQHYKNERNHSTVHVLWPDCLLVDRRH